ncbi:MULTISPECIES: prephenate/arogenate dehydrogenase family protein [unclassified Caulobacter]|uniref:prephenate/arogenate dehydrogenase family protein n=1 Tax=unclassified Caulobacter TaxID=2648921 RepID=UPI000D3A7509|nr:MULTISPECIES: prephenate/arogenate dehydrogenase family protein [unclassified Caulobacter]PTS83206.1 prephenate/arogenate dehydrogenase family protein [Caulobacter sp. HMWF009]PTT05360.1 prephenate/arogenate dehydrogenase family protein [Caulobacter sp. HMWF025]
MPKPGVLYPKMTVIGCGLIGGSVIRAARAHGVVGEITVADASEAHRARVVELGLADHVTGDIAEAVRDADLVVIATPVLSVPELASTVIPAMKAGATLTDVGSTKANVAEAFRAQDCSKIFAIPGHPIAGTEQSGPDAGFAELFENRWTILTPFESDDEAYAAAVAKLSALWRSFGAQVELMEEKHHDLVLAVVSHLPHLIAYTIVGSAADLENVTESEVIKFSASGFRDFTRIAASDPTMWRDIFVANKDAVLEMLGRFTEDLQAMSRAIRWGDADTLHSHFTRTRAIRRGIVAAGQESAEPNFGRDRGKH